MPHFVDLLSAARKHLQFCPLHISNIYVKKRGIGKKLILTIQAVMLGEQVDLVAGDFNGAAWRCNDGNKICTIEEAFADFVLPTLPGTRFDPKQTLTFVGPLNRPNLIGIGKFDFTAPFSIPHEAQGLRPTDQSCHHETWLHLDFIDWREGQSQREKKNQRILLKERPAPYHYVQQKTRISDIMSDHSLSS